MVARLYETLRCVSAFEKYDENILAEPQCDRVVDAGGDVCRRLIKSLREDYERRSPYLTYLVRCRQGLASMLSQQERLLSRSAVDRRVCSAYLVSVCIRQFLEQREKQTAQFVSQVRHNIYRECTSGIHLGNPRKINIVTINIKNHVPIDKLM